MHEFTFFPFRVKLEGQMFGFNNTIPHEVINPSSSPRIVLLFDVLLPEIQMDRFARAKVVLLGESGGVLAWHTVVRVYYPPRDTVAMG